METIGTRIKRLREQERMTQQELAAKLTQRGVPTKRLSVIRWEAGTNIPTTAPAMEMAKIFGTTSDYLIEGKLAESMACTVTEREIVEAVRRRPRLVCMWATVKELNDEDIALVVRVIKSVKAKEQAQ